VRERQLDHDAVGSHASEALGEVSEQRDDALFYAREVQYRELPGGAMRLAAEAVVRQSESPGQRRGACPKRSS
jgi:hypothetical protein